MDIVNEKYVSDVPLKDKPRKKISLRIRERSITNPKISDGAVTNEKIADGTLTGEKFVDDSIDGVKVKDNSVPGSKLADGSITGVDIEDGTLSGVKLVDNSVSGSKLEDDSIESRHLVDNSVPGSKIKDNSLQGIDFQDGSISGEKIVDESITSAKIADNAITENKIAEGAVTTAKLANDSVTTQKIVDGAVTTDKIGNGEVKTADIADEAVTAAKIADGSVSAMKLASNAVTEDKLADGSVIAAKIAANAVTTAKIGDGEVTEGKIANGAITTEKLSTPVIEQLQTIMDDVPTVGSVKPVSSGGVLMHGSAFDVSEYNKSEGTLATYETLSAALAAVPASIKKGGMSIKFIQLTPATYSVVRTEGLTEQPTGTELQSVSAVVSGTYNVSQLSDFTTLPATTGAANAVTYYAAVSGDAVTYTSWAITKVTSDSNKYVQYRLMRTAWSDIEYNWSSVEDEIERQELIAKTKVSSKALTLSEAGGRATVAKNLRMDSIGVIGSGGNVGKITYTGLIPKGTVVHLTGTVILSYSGVLHAYIGFMVEDPASFDSLLGVKANDLISIALKKGYPVDVYFEVPYDSYLIISRDTNQLDIDSVRVFKPVELPAIDDEPVTGSDNLVKSGGVFAQIKKEVQDSISNTAAVFDISKWNAENGVPKTYSSLANALVGNNVPTDVRKPGMSIKFIQLTPKYYSVVKTEGVETLPTGTEVQEALSYATGTYTEEQLSGIELPTTVGASKLYYLAVTEENTVEPEEGEEPVIETVTTYTTWEITYDSAEAQEYVQYRLMSTSYNTTVANWQGVDKVPVYNSPNLITSGAVEAVINDRVCFKNIFTFTNRYDINRGTGKLYSASDRIATEPFYLIEPYNIGGYIVLANDVSALLGSICVAFYSTNSVTYGFLGTSGLVKTTKIPIVEGAKYIRVSLTNIPSGNKANANLDNLFLYKNNVLGNIGGDIEKLNASVQDINTNIAAINEEIAEINGDSVYNLNKDKHEVIFSAKCQEGHYAYSPNNAMVAFLVMTDIHTDKGRFNRGLAYANDESLIDEVLVLGDVCDVPSELRSWNYEADVLTCNKPVLTIPGNHEVASSGSHVPFTNQEFMDKFYTPTLVEKNGDIHGENETWWYKDVSHNYINDSGTTLAKTIRVISINQVDYCAAIDKNTWYLSQAQIDWFVNLLDSTPDDYYVLVISHVAFDSDFTPVDCKFTGPVNASTYPALADKSFITNIIRAWINGSTVQATTTNSADNLEVSVNHTFANAHTNKFIGILAGHSHRDFVSRINGEEAIYQFSLHCTTSNTHQQAGDLGRTGKTGDCLTVFVYDWFKHRVKLIRIGADITTGMTRRDFDAIDLV